MHTTRTSTKLLLSVAGAVSAVSGCVNVTPASMQPAGAPGTTGAPPPRHDPRGGPGAAVEVQAPALEALKAVPREPTASATGTGRAPGGAAAPAAAPPVPDIPEPRKPAERAAGGKSAGAAQRPAAQAELPREVMDQLPVRPADVCALGRTHGRWTPDSPESRICEDVRTP
ncbi:hypothetical protein ABZ924_33730 [Streptomyces sp. NPDC046876]|uniref:hypothetical protein n=1 Tax=Streptomyces sp. NPDC046876 TaxID=3155616 RepID=UPI0034010509